MRNGLGIAIICASVGLACGKDDGSDGGGDGGEGGTAATVADADGSGGSGGSGGATSTTDASADASAGSSSDASITTNDAGSDSIGDGTTDPSTSDDSGGDTGGMLQCEPMGQSSCGNPNSIISGHVSLAADGPSTGALFVGLAHSALGSGSTGGVPHTGMSTPGVDLSQGPVPFSLDMCTGGEMWSEENCSFELIVILDQNDNQSAGNFLPDAGEPAKRTTVSVSCNGPAPCLDIELDCTDGGACVTFADPAYCGCNPPGGCNSPIDAC